jgi:TusA-related sulfurtransferase
LPDTNRKNEKSNGYITKRWEVLATDKGAVNDLSAWSKSSGHELLEHKEEDGVFKFYIQKG